MSDPQKVQTLMDFTNVPKEAAERLLDMYEGNLEVACPHADGYSRSFGYRCLLLK